MYLSNLLDTIAEINGKISDVRIVIKTPVPINMLFGLKLV